MELIPCPFCGCTVPALEHGAVSPVKVNDGIFSTSWHVQCPICGTTQGWFKSQYKIGPDERLVLADPSHDGRAEAIAAWNRRTDPPHCGAKTDKQEKEPTE